LTSEYHLSDEEAGELIGLKATLDVIFGFAGSFLTDFLGVRITSVAGMLAGVAGRGLVAFGRSKASLRLAYLLFSPFGEAILYTGLYKVALKKVTTPRTRALAFSLSYAMSNLGGAVSDVLIDTLRVMGDFKLGAAVYTSIRTFLVITWCTTVFMLVIAVLFLRNETIIDEADPEVGGQSIDLQELSGANNAAFRRGRSMSTTGALLSTEAQEEAAMMATLGAKSALPVAAEAHRTSLGKLLQAFMTERRSRLRTYRVVPTKLRPAGGSQRRQSKEGPGGEQIVENTRQVAAAGCRDVLQILRLRELWMVITFSLCSFTVAAQWAATSILMPVYLERSFGESVPIFTILSINFWGCVLLPPIVAVMTIHLETFRVVMPGLWIMGASPFLLALRPSPAGAVAWQVFLTIGEVIWSPRVVAWAATLAPAGREGVFLAFASAREALTPLLDVLYGYLAQAYVPNCRDLGCRDEYGHFCDAPDKSLNTCSSSRSLCEVVLQENLACPTSCQDCPGWSSDPFMLWGIIAGSSIAGPVMVWLLLPFIRAGSCRGVFDIGPGRVLGICGWSEPTKGSQ